MQDFQGGKIANSLSVITNDLMKCVVVFVFTDIFLLFCCVWDNVRSVMRINNQLSSSPTAQLKTVFTNNNKYVQYMFNVPCLLLFQESASHRGLSGTINFPLSFWTRVKDSNVIVIVCHYQRQILAAPQHQCRLCGRVRAQFSRHSSRSLRGSAVGVFTAVNSFVWVCVHVLLHNISVQLHCICVEVSKHMQIQMHPCLLPFQFICMFLQHVCLFAPLWGYAMHIPQLQENNILGRLACMRARVCVWFVSLPCLPQGGAVPFPIIVQILPEIMPLRIWCVTKKNDSKQ